METPIRYHDPTEKLSRGFGEKITIWIVQVFLIIFLYYYSTINDFSLIGNTQSIIRLLEQETVLLFDIQIFILFGVLTFLSKLFYRGSVFCGVLLGEWFVQSYLQPSLPFNWAITLIPLFFTVVFMFTPYKGEEYHELRTLLRDSYLILGSHGFLMLYTFIVFEHSYIGYFAILLCIGSFLSHLLLIPIGFYVLDTFLQRYFPFSPEEQKALEKYDINRGDDFWDDYLMPEPGELYFPLITHHSVEDDDHTIWFLLGKKVRLYLCTRCSGMFLGVLFAMLFESISRNAFGYTLPDDFYIYFNIIIPGIALLDWGTQKVALRQSTTISRLLTGFTIGIAMNNINQIPHQYTFHLINLFIYFCIFFLLFFFGERRPGKPRILNRN